MLRIMKFGGISLKDVNSFRCSSEIIISGNEEKVAVLSAIYGITDALHKAVIDAKIDEQSIPVFIKSIKAAHYDIANAIIDEPAILKSTLAALDAKIKKLERVLYGVAYTEEITTKTKDLVVSFGERLSVEIMAGLLNAKGVKAKALDADTIGMVTDGIFGNSTALLPFIEKNFKETLVPLIKGGVLPVVTGYFGCDIDGKTTTFSRGGSDYGAAVIANALSADILEVWKDVDGFMTANPKIIKNAKKIEKMTYDEAAELAYFGAKVLHPRTIEPVAQKNIPIIVKNVFKPGKKGTTISGEPLNDCTPIRGIANKDNLAILKLYGLGMAYTPGVALKVFSRLTQKNINVYAMATSQASFALVIEDAQVEKSVEALEEVKDDIIKRIEPMRNVSLICIVGQGISTTKGIASQIFSAIAKAKINVLMISQGSSEIAFSIVVADDDVKETMAVVHDTFSEC